MCIANTSYNLKEVIGVIGIACIFHLKIDHIKVGKVVTPPMIKFKDAFVDLRKYESTICHKNSLEDNYRFIAVIANKKQSAIMQVNNSISNQVGCNIAKSDLGNVNKLLKLCINS